MPGAAFGSLGEGQGGEDKRVAWRCQW
jgi:hypothetical protein